MAAEAYSSVEEIKRLDSELVSLKGSNISTPISLQLETARHEIVDLKTRLDAIQVKYESAKKEIGCYMPQIQDLEFAVSKIRFTAYAKDEELIATYNQKEVDELQRFRVGMLKKNKQLKGEKDGLEASIGEVVGEVSSQAGAAGGEVSAQAGAAGGEAPDDATAKSVAAAEFEATE
ncbi:hypothetical protein ACFXTO_000464 [Malus domestica]